MKPRNRLSANDAAFIDASNRNCSSFPLQSTLRELRARRRDLEKAIVHLQRVQSLRTARRRTLQMQGPETLERLRAHG